MVKNLIVGCGFSGATLAYKIATELNEEVVVIDAKITLAAIVMITMITMVFAFINTGHIFFIQT